MRVQDSIVKLAKLEAENEQLKKQQFANEKRIAELEAYTRESAPALKAAANTTNKLVETLTEQTTHMRDELKEIREILNRALPPKSGDKPPPASTKAASPAPKIESGVDPFSLPQQ